MEPSTATTTVREYTTGIDAGRRIGWVLGLSLGVLALLALTALFAPLIAPQNPKTTDLLAAFQGPSGSHPLGTDGSGRDLLSRLIVGARTSLVAPLLVVMVACAVGTAIGIGAAWVGGRLDAAASATLDILFSFPGLLLAIVAVALFGEGLTAPIVALSIAYIPYVGRVVRGAALKERGLPYVDACIAQGFGATKVCVRHILPNVTPLILTQAALSFGYAMVDLAAISFLGLGVQPPTPDWGLMVAEGQASVLRGQPEEALLAGFLIVITVAATNLAAARLGKLTSKA